MEGQGLGAAQISTCQNWDRRRPVCGRFSFSFSMSACAYEYADAYVYSRRNLYACVQRGNRDILNFRCVAQVRK